MGNYLILIINKSWIDYCDYILGYIIQPSILQCSGERIWFCNEYKRSCNMLYWIDNWSDFQFFRLLLQKSYDWHFVWHSLRYFKYGIYNRYQTNLSNNRLGKCNVLCILFWGNFNISDHVSHWQACLLL